MSRAKTERLLNLVICLLAANRFVTKEEIREVVPGYSPSTSAFERAFERDKEELREMGIPIETGSNDRWFADDPGYRIRRDAYALPEVSFAPDEMAVLSLAAQAWQQAALAGPASTALLKLRAYGVDTASAGIAGLDPRVDTDEAAFLPLWQAVRDRAPVSFDYRRPGGEPERRLVEPWGLVSWHGRWYLVGHDRNRAATRVFRVSRVTGDVERAGNAGSVAVPEGVDLRSAVRTEAEAPTGTAVLRVRQGAAGFLRRRALVEEPADDGWDRVELTFRDAGLLADDVAGLGSAVVVLEPAPLREAVVRRLRAVLDANQPPWSDEVTDDGGPDGDGAAEPSEVRP